MNDLIDSLTNDLKPVKPMRVWPLWLGAGAGLLLAGLYIWFMYGPRPELSALTYGNWSGNNMSVMKPMMFLIMGLSAIWAVAGLTRPEGRLKLRYMLPVLAIGGVVLGNLVSDLARSGMEGMADGLNGGVSVCFTTILCGGTAGLVVLWRFWLRKAATSYPVALGAMSGLATASLMASAYALHCNMDAPVYIVLVYGLAVAIFSGFAALLGGRLLKW